MTRQTHREESNRGQVAPRRSRSSDQGTSDATGPTDLFAADGSLKGPGPDGERRRQQRREKLERAKANPDKVTADYRNVETDREDEWTLKLPAIESAELNEIRSLMFDLKTWTDDAVGPGPSTWIEKVDEHTYRVEIQGRNGKRCHWAHSFLTAFNRALIDDHGAMIRIDQSCGHGYTPRC